MSETAYRWKPGAGVPVRADVAGAELERIRAANEGVLRPADVVAESEPAEAPLHPAFEWDDERAADLYRQDQARQVIRSLRVVRAGEEAADPQPVYLHVAPADDPRGQQYLPTAEVMADEELRSRALAEAVAQLRGWQKRYGGIRELAGVSAAIDQAAAAAKPAVAA